MARDNKIITVSAPGKIHFLGEHVVVYGKPALLAAIDKRCTVLISPRKDKKIEIISKNFNKSAVVSPVAVLEGTKLAQKKWQEFIKTGNVTLLLNLTKDPLSYPILAIGETLLYYQDRHSGDSERSPVPDGTGRSVEDSRISNVRDAGQVIDPRMRASMTEGFTLTIDSNIPIGAGLGSSAALAVSIAAAVSLFLKKSHPELVSGHHSVISTPSLSRGRNPQEISRRFTPRDDNLDLESIYDIAFRAEQKKHGRPSGGDPATVLHGGLLWFRKETNDLKIIQPVPFSIPESIAQKFYIIDTGRPKESTGEMIARVKAFHDTHTEQAHRIFDDQENLTRQLLSAIKKSDDTLIIRIIRAGERNLEKLGVVSSYVKKLIRDIEKSGGAAKISGGGGAKKGTGMLLVYHNNRKRLEAVLQSQDLPFFQTQLGVEGLRLGK